LEPLFSIKKHSKEEHTELLSNVFHELTEGYLDKKQSIWDKTTLSEDQKEDQTIEILISTSMLFQEAIKELNGKVPKEHLKDFNSIKLNDIADDILHYDFMMAQGNSIDGETVGDLLVNKSKVKVSKETTNAVVNSFLSIQVSNFNAENVIKNLIDHKLNSKVSDKQAEELGWFKYIQMLIAETPRRKKQFEALLQKELSNNPDGKVTQAKLREMLQEVLKTQQEEYGLSYPYEGDKFYKATGGLPDVLGNINGEYLFIPVNKLTDNIMESTQKARHPALIALAQLLSEGFDDKTEKEKGKLIVEWINKNNSKYGISEMNSTLKVLKNPEGFYRDAEQKKAIEDLIPQGISEKMLNNDKESKEFRENFINKIDDIRILSFQIMPDPFKRVKDEELENLDWGESFQKSGTQNKRNFLKGLMSAILFESHLLNSGGEDFVLRGEKALNQSSMAHEDLENDKPYHLQVNKMYSSVRRFIYGLVKEGTDNISNNTAVGYIYNNYAMKHKNKNITGAFLTIFSYQLKEAYNKGSITLEQMEHLKQKIISKHSVKVESKHYNTEDNLNTFVEKEGRLQEKEGRLQAQEENLQAQEQTKQKDEVIKQKDEAMKQKDEAMKQKDEEKLQAEEQTKQTNEANAWFMSLLVTDSIRFNQMALEQNKIESPEDKALYIVNEYRKSLLPEPKEIKLKNKRTNNIISGTQKVEQNEFNELKSQFEDSGEFKKEEIVEIYEVRLNKEEEPIILATTREFPATNGITWEIGSKDFELALKPEGTEPQQNIEGGTPIRLISVKDPQAKNSKVAVKRKKGPRM
jgi:hypothetical protein